MNYMFLQRLAVDHEIAAPVSRTRAKIQRLTSLPLPVIIMSDGER